MLFFVFYFCSVLYLAPQMAMYFDRKNGSFLGSSVEIGNYVTIWCSVEGGNKAKVC